MTLPPMYVVNTGSIGIISGSTSSTTTINDYVSSINWGNALKIKESHPEKEKPLEKKVITLNEFYQFQPNMEVSFKSGQAVTTKIKVYNGDLVEWHTKKGFLVGDFSPTPLRHLKDSRCMVYYPDIFRDWEGYGPGSKRNHWYTWKGLTTRRECWNCYVGQFLVKVSAAKEPPDDTWI